MLEIIRPRIEPIEINIDFRGGRFIMGWNGFGAVLFSNRTRWGYRYAIFLREIG